MALVQAIPGRKIRCVYVHYSDESTYTKANMIHVSMFYPEENQTKVYELYLKSWTCLIPFNKERDILWIVQIKGIERALNSVSKISKVFHVSHFLRYSYNSLFFSFFFNSSPLIRLESKERVSEKTCFKIQAFNQGLLKVIFIVKYSKVQFKLTFLFSLSQCKKNNNNRRSFKFLDTSWSSQIWATLCSKCRSLWW